MRKRRRGAEQDESEVNLTPMLDVIFNLLFFFILATTLRQDYLEIAVDLPSMEHG